MAKAKGLTKADAQLWAAFTQNISLLPGKTRLPTAPEPASKVDVPPPPSIEPKPVNGARPVMVGAPPAGLDKSSWKKFRAGDIRAARRLDLHGLTASRAHHATTAFIQTAQAEQIRCVEIITGKGEVLARELPHWLNAPPIRPLILAMAHPHEANTGSVRILLKRTR